MSSVESDKESPTPIWVAGDIEMDVARQRVRKSGLDVELPKLSFDLLLALMQCSPGFASNEALMQRVWKGLVVSPETVTQRIKLLRDALGDDPRQPRYIAGLRSRGYRLIPDARILPYQPPVSIPVPVPAADTDGIAAPREGPRSTSPHMWAVASIGVALLGSAVFWLGRALPDRSPQSVTEEDRTAAVLPFTIVGTLTGGDELAMGLTDSVLAQLAGVRGLSVISRNSSFQVDAPKLGLEETGKRLGARYLVEASIQQHGDNRRVTVRVLDSHNGNQLWTQQYDRAATDFFGMQDVVATGVARSLEARIAGLDPAIPVSARSQNLEAYLAYLRGRAQFGRTTIVGADAAAVEFQKAMTLDPSFVPAIVGLYDARLQAASLRRTDMATARDINEPLLARALALQPDSGAVLLARAMWSSEPADIRSGYFERGLLLDPANARAMTAYSELLDSEDREKEGAVWLDRALRIDPLWPRARFRYAQRNFPTVGSAIEQQTLRTLELDPNYYPALQRQAKYRWMHHGDLSRSIAVIEQAIASDPENPWGRHTAAAFYLDLNEPGSAEDVVRGNTVAELGTRALRALYRGDWRAAGEAALQEGSFVFGGAERWGVPSALRDFALRGQQVEKVVALLSRRYQLPLGERWRLSTGNFREGQMLAHLLLATGQRKEGLRRLDEVAAWIDANAFVGPVYNLRTQAQILALKGENDAALERLAESFRQKDFTHWWYTLNFDPTWNALRLDPRFVQIAATVRAHVADQAALIDQQRKAGQIPDRRMGASPVARERQ